MDEALRVACWGLGPIGAAIADVLAGRAGIALVAAFDSDPAKIGEKIAGIRIAPPPDQIPDCDVAIVATSSRLAAVRPLAERLLARGIDVVTTCEELVWPWDDHPGAAAELDAIARENGSSLLATGVNPGFVMDWLPLAISGVAARIDHVRVERIQDAAPRREPFRRKIGVGLAAEAFRVQVGTSALGHVGLGASLRLIAAGIGRKIDRIDEHIEPVIAAAPDGSDGVIGVAQEAIGYSGGRELVRLVFRATVGEPDPYDRVVIAGEPPIDLVVRGGFPGDTATTAIIANAVPAIVATPAGLRTMLDFAAIRCRG